MDSGYAAVYPQLYRHHWWWRVREEILLSRLAPLLEQIPHAARILDVGCGAGLFFDALQSFGHIEGIESDPIAVANAGKWRDHIHHGKLDETFTPVEPYDVILMLDVLEHLPEPERLLRDAREILKPGGRVVITVPAFNWLWTSHDDLNHHVCRYTGPQMRDTVTSAGFTVTASTYLFQSLILPKLLVRLQESLLTMRPSPPAVPSQTVNAALTTWYRAEYAVARWLPFGTSLMVVAKSAS